MYIFEEYAERIQHKQTLIKYANKSFIFFASYPRKILEIEKTTSPNAPGKFRISERLIDLVPIGDQKDADVEWDAYEDYIISKYKGSKNAIIDTKIVFISSWETFLYYNQNCFINCFGHNSIYKTIDLSLSEEERINNINYTIDVLKLENNMVYNNWIGFRYNPDNYSYWLANIIND